MLRWRKGDRVLGNDVFARVVNMGDGGHGRVMGTLNQKYYLRTCMIIDDGG